LLFPNTRIYTRIDPLKHSNLSSFPIIEVILGFLCDIVDVILRFEYEIAHSFKFIYFNKSNSYIKNTTLSNLNILTILIVIIWEFLFTVESPAWDRFSSCKLLEILIFLTTENKTRLQLSYKILVICFVKRSYDFCWLK